MKKKIVGAVVAAALLVGGSTYTYQTFAAEGKYSTSTTEKSNLEVSQAQEDSNITINPISTVPSDEIHIPLDLANSNAVSNYSRSTTTTNNPITKLLGSYVTESAEGNEVRANYILESGSAVDIMQVPLNISPDSAVAFYTSGIYPDAEVTTGEINGFKAVYVNGEYRRAIHLISDNYAYTINTVFQDVNIDYLENVAKLIKE